MSIKLENTIKISVDDEVYTSENLDSENQNDIQAGDKEKKITAQEFIRKSRNFTNQKYIVNLENVEKKDLKKKISRITAENNNESLCTVCNFINVLCCFNLQSENEQ